jgi:cytosine/adenosine deaminase-related metal-dependent hydrolase
MSDTPDMVGQRQPCDLIIKNATVFTMDKARRVLAPGSIAITGPKIVAVGTDAEVADAFRAARVFDAHGGLVHPGFIDCHYHATIHLTRGFISDEPGHGAVSITTEANGDPAVHESDEAAIGDYSRWFNALEDEDEYASSLLACVEMLRNGFTYFMEPGTAFEPDLVAAAATATGIRASVTDPYVWDLPDSLPAATEIDRVPATRKRAESILGTELKRNEADDALVRGHIGLYGSGSASQELMLAAKECADANNVIYTQHQNFDPDSVAADDTRFGKHALAHYADIGLLGPNTTFVHMNAIRDDEFDAIVDSGMSIIWHAGNYQFYSLSTVLPNRMPELHEAGVNLSFGVDAAKIWTFGDMGPIAYLSARASGQFIPATDIFAMQTIGAAQAVGMSSAIGSIEVGKQADLVIRTDDLAEAQPGADPINQLIFLSRSQSVDVVIVAGRVVVKNRKLILVDEDVVYEMARASAHRVGKAAGLI